ncbi:hypothetical protein [Lysinibacillus sp. BPa_S21]|uniref:hypothetical protein n=1 Tax=Lysinibacillus sp. BPa_S21 TaxID=2932478 RepID=UPI00201221A1|nr:hypothetical protein [Lysinibacillus sp. BPa_S21]MCL1695023.1 hypothetical protein [Lysinibacillus sp. BPa_S21]
MYEYQKVKRKIKKLYMYGATIAFVACTSPFVSYRSAQALVDSTNENTAGIEASDDSTNENTAEIEASDDSTNENTAGIEASDDSTNENTAGIEASDDSTNENTAEIEASEDSTNENTAEIEASDDSTNENTAEIEASDDSSNENTAEDDLDIYQAVLQDDFDLNNFLDQVLQNKTLDEKIISLQGIDLDKVIDSLIKNRKWESILPFIEVYDEFRNDLITQREQIMYENEDDIYQAVLQDDFDFNQFLDKGFQNKTLDEQIDYFNAIDANIIKGYLGGDNEKQQQFLEAYNNIRNDLSYELYEQYFGEIAEDKAYNDLYRAMLQEGHDFYLQNFLDKVFQNKTLDEQIDYLNALDVDLAADFDKIDEFLRAAESYQLFDGIGYWRLRNTLDAERNNLNAERNNLDLEESIREAIYQAVFQEEERRIREEEERRIQEEERRIREDIYQAVLQEDFDLNKFLDNVFQSKTLDEQIDYLNAQDVRRIQEYLEEGTSYQLWIDYHNIKNDLIYEQYEQYLGEIAEDKAYNDLFRTAFQQGWFVVNRYGHDHVQDFLDKVFQNKTLDEQIDYLKTLKVDLVADFDKILEFYRAATGYDNFDFIGMLGDDSPLYFMQFLERDIKMAYIARIKDPLYEAILQDDYKNFLDKVLQNKTLDEKDDFLNYVRNYGGFTYFPYDVPEIIFNLYDVIDSAADTIVGHPYIYSGVQYRPAEQYALRNKIAQEFDWYNFEVMYDLHYRGGRGQEEFNNMMKKEAIEYPRDYWTVDRIEEKWEETLGVFESSKYMEKNDIWYSDAVYTSVTSAQKNMFQYLIYELKELYSGTNIHVIDTHFSRKNFAWNGNVDVFFITTSDGKVWRSNTFYGNPNFSTGSGTSYMSKDGEYLLYDPTIQSNGLYVRPGVLYDPNVPEYKVTQSFWLYTEYEIIDNGGEEGSSNEVQPGGETGEGSSNEVQPGGETGEGSSNAVQPGGETGEGSSNEVQPGGETGEGSSNEVQPGGETGEGSSNEVQPGGETGEGSSNEVQPGGETGEGSSNEVQPGGEPGEGSSNEGQPGGETGEGSSNENTAGGETSEGSSNENTAGGETSEGSSNENPAGGETGEGSSNENPAGDETGEGSSNENPAGDETGEVPTNENPASDETGEEPSNENPAGDEIGEEPTNENPVGDETGEEPATENPAGDEIGEGPTNENPAGDETNEEPTNENPAGDESSEDSPNDNKTIKRFEDSPFGRRRFDINEDYVTVEDEDEHVSSFFELSVSGD